MYEDNFSVEYAQNIFIRIPLVAIVLALVGFLVFHFNWPIFFGILLGGGVSLLSFWSQVQYVQSVIFAEKPKRFILGSLLRLGATAGAFVLAILVPHWFNILAVFIGVMISPGIILVYRRRPPATVKGGQKEK